MTAWAAKVSSEGDLALGEGPHLPAVQVDCPDGRALPEQRHRQLGAHARCTRRSGR